LENFVIRAPAKPRLQNGFQLRHRHTTSRVPASSKTTGADKTGAGFLFFTFCLLPFTFCFYFLLLLLAIHFLPFILAFYFLPFAFYFLPFAF
jgi:hypothetical protein